MAVARMSEVFFKAMRVRAAQMARDYEGDTTNDHEDVYKVAAFAVKCSEEIDFLTELVRDRLDTDKYHQDNVKRLSENVMLARAEAEYLRTLVPKRFFNVDDGGIDYSVVAADLEHAKRLLRAHGVEMMSKEEDVEGEMFGLSVPVGDPRSAEEWTEITLERAKNIRVALGDDGAPPVVPLAECKVGDWFCSEY